MTEGRTFASEMPPGMLSSANVAASRSKPSHPGERLLELRRARKWSQEQVAARAGLTVRTVRNLERCATAPERIHPETYEKLARLFEVPIEELDPRRRRKWLAEADLTPEHGSVGGGAANTEAAPGQETMSRRRRCLNEEQMAAVVDGTAGFEETEHLATCKRCGETRELIVGLIRAFGDEVEVAEEALSRVEKRGRDCVSRIEGGVAPHRWQFAATRDGASPAIANAMLDRFEALMDIASPDALSMADAAISLAGFAGELVADDGASLRCRAWKAKAVALASFACYDEALQALDEAAGAAEDIADVASIAYARAWLLGSPDVWRPREALEILEKHSALFDQVSAARYRTALLLQAVIRVRTGDLATAELELNQLGPLMETPVERAMISGNLAMCRLRRGDADGARKLARAAASVYRSEGSAGTLRLLQVEWIIAQASGALREPEDGLVIARRVADEFERMHFDEHAVRAELTCIQLMLACDPDADVQEACERVLELSSRWPGPRAVCAAEALQYLRDMAARRAVTIDDAITVETYIDELRTAKPVRFRPPMPLVAM